ncbi:MAG: HD domain-containing protein [Planctomycetes bacterium]|nr:HD domain-containing protein [Planctomycetota bacterium]
MIGAGAVGPIERIFEQYRVHGHRCYGETVSEREHALQCATIAEAAGEEDLVIAACLLHDYGHLCHEKGEGIASRGVDARHEELGAAALAAWFRPELVEGVRLHVEAKRYLCFLDPRYAARLSPASATSLRLQGGRHSAEEARAFSAGPHAALAVKVRRYDELAKQPGRKTPPLESFREVLVAWLLPSAADGARQA